MIGFVSSTARALIPLEFQVEGDVRMVSLPVAATVTAATTNACLAQFGLGLIQVPRYWVARELAAGTLVEVLANHPPTPSPVFLLYVEDQQLSPRVRLSIGPRRRSSRGSPKCEAPDHGHAADVDVRCRANAAFFERG